MTQNPIEKEIIDYLQAKIAQHGRSYVIRAMKTIMRGKLAKEDRDTRQFTRKDVAVAFHRQKGICPDCEEEMSLYDSRSKKYAVGEHIIPRSRGGQTIRGNCRATCQECNARKSDEEPLDYATRTGKPLTNLIVMDEDNFACEED
jgi:5-methylcytosine-specific restriction endonuclease McrA